MPKSNDFRFVCLSLCVWHGMNTKKTLFFLFANARAQAHANTFNPENDSSIRFFFLLQILWMFFISFSMSLLLLLRYRHFIACASAIAILSGGTEMWEPLLLLQSLFFCLHASPVPLFYLSKSNRLNWIQSHTIRSDSIPSRTLYIYIVMKSHWNGIPWYGKWRIELNEMENQIQCEIPIEKEKLRHLISLKLNAIPRCFLSEKQCWRKNERHVKRKEKKLRKIRQNGIWNKRN